MSYVFCIQRHSSPITEKEVSDLVSSDDTLCGGEKEPILWTDPETEKERYINFDTQSGVLDTDDLRGSEEETMAFIDKLRSIAISLDARLVGEEGEDVTNEETSELKKTFSGCASVIVFGLILAGFLGDHLLS